MIPLPPTVGPEEVFAFFNVSRESQVRLRHYADLLQRWQSRINLIGPETVPILWQRHIADGLQLIRFVGTSPRTVIDVGTGAGIPGLVLKLAFPQHRVTLIESNTKKAAFLAEAARQGGVDVEILGQRAERVDSDPYRREPPVVTARAVAPLADLLDMTEKLRDTGTGLFYKGETADDELTDSAVCWRIRYVKHRSIVEPKGSIIEVLEARRIHDQHDERGG